MVTEKEISQMVLNGRNFTQLISLTPGVSNQTGQDEGTVGVYGNVSWSVNGGRVEYNNWELDGGDNMDNGSNSTLNVYPSVDAIEEFKVLTSNYGAQYGRNGSGTIETVTKSGRKEFHGDAYEFVRNNDFNARNFFRADRAVVQEERLRIHHRRSRLHPEGVQHEKGQDILFLERGMAQETGCRLRSITRCRPTEERQGNFTDVCPAAAGAVNTTDLSGLSGQPGDRKHIIRTIQYLSIQTPRRCWR